MQDVALQSEAGEYTDVILFPSKVVELGVHGSDSELLLESDLLSLTTWQVSLFTKP